MDTKSVLTTTSANKSSYVTSPIGSLQLTVEECNDIMMKRAVAAAQQQQQQQQHQQQHHQQQQQHQTHSTIAASDGHHAGECGFGDGGLMHLARILFMFIWFV